MFPDGIVFSTGVYALITLSFPFAVFFISLLESTLVFHALKYAGKFLNPYGVGTATLTANPICKSGFTFVGLDTFSLFTSKNFSTFPSAPLYMLSVACSYLFGSLYTLSQELGMLGTVYASRFYWSIILLLLLLFFFGVLRLTAGCDGYMTTVSSILIGLIMGLVLVYQNKSIFGTSGKDALNLIGIPLLKNRAANGQPLYICPTSNTSISD